jgi:hypothetical protein
VKLKVLIADDGHIVSLSWLREPSEQAAGKAPLLSGVEPGKGQRAAIVDVDPALHGLSLSEIHRRFSVAEHGQAVRLVERRT